MKTSNLDLAAYITSHGCEPRIKYIHPTLAEFTFSDKVAAEKARKTFYSGDARVNLSKYIANRSYLKTAAKKLGVSKGAIVTSEDKEEWAHVLGRPYWFIEDGAVFHNIFGHAQIHKDRYNSHNHYPTRQAAESNLNNNL